MFTIIAIAVPLLILLVYIPINLIKNNNLVIQYGLLAKELGVNLHLKTKVIRPFYPTLNCNYKERTLIVNDFFYGGGWTSDSGKGHNTKISVSINNKSNFGLYIKSYTFTGKIKKILDYKQLEFNDNKLNSLLNVQTSNITIAKLLLEDEDIKKSLLDYFKKYKNQYLFITLDKNKIFSYNIQGMFSEFIRQTIEARINILYLFANKLEEINS